MKKTKVFLILLCLAVVLTGCNKEKKEGETASAGSETKNTSVKTVKQETADSIILYDGTPFYLENEDGKMVYNDEALLGEQIKVYLLDGQLEQKEAIRLLSSGKEETFNFVHVSYYDNDYWTRDIFITNNSEFKPGIITADTLTYSAADGTTATSKKLEEGTVVAIDPASKQKDSDLDIEFISVTYYSGTAFGKTAFVKLENLSDTPGDIIANQTISRILANESIKPEIADILFEELEVIPTSFYMSEKIKAAKAEESGRRK